MSCDYERFAGLRMKKRGDESGEDFYARNEKTAR
jgi:hypothetical protein